MKLLQRLLTRNLNKIPLFYVTFNYNKYIRNGEKGSCNAHVHPNLRGDKYIHDTINELIDYIRNNYDLKGL